MCYYKETNKLSPAVTEHKEMLIQIVKSQILLSVLLHKSSVYNRTYKVWPFQKSHTLRAELH